MILIIHEFTVKTGFCHFDSDLSGEKSQNYNKNKRFLFASRNEVIEPFKSELIHSYIL